VSFELNPDLEVIQKEGYGALDLISDIGGLLGLLVSFCSFFVNLYNYNYFENFIVSKLFKAELNGSTDTEVNSSFWKRHQFMNPS
jgi:hypothetical protein